MTKTSLYFLAIEIPEPIASEIRELQEYAALHFETHAALRSPPHITLVPPFSSPVSEIDTISEVLVPPLHVINSFDISLNGFGAFDKRVIYIHVEPNPYLSNLASLMSQTLRKSGFNIKLETRAYHPHVTVAFKDLRREMFREAWSYFNSVRIQCIFRAEGMSLLNHRGGKWVPVNSWTLSGT